MIIDLDKGEVSENRTSVCLGNFDGVHIAHQGLIEEVLICSKEWQLIPSVLLFKENTKIITKHKNMSILMTLEEKINIFKEMGIQICFLKTFDEEFMQNEPEDFIKKYLIEKINAKSVVVGYDYKFGKNASGDANMLLKYQDKSDIKVSVIPEIKDEGCVISSSCIRNLIRNGEIERANKLLSRPFSIKGKIVKGEQRGRNLGFPTANLKPCADYVIPKDGVYKTEIEIDGKIYSSATSVGLNMTFGAKKRTIETYIENFNENIYGKTVTLYFFKFERDMIKFNNSDDLVAQMERDVKN